MKKYRYLLWDVDGTLLNFKAAEKVAIFKAYKDFGYGECNDELLGIYSKINDNYWEMFEEGKISKEDLLVDRFKDFFVAINLECKDPAAFNDLYHNELGETIVYCDNSYELLKSLKNKYVNVAITNGTKSVQDRKLFKSGFDKLFDDIFISEVIGTQKPNVDFINIVINKMRINNKNEMLIIGDSLTSDIKLGNNSNIDTVWYNPNRIVNNKNVNPTYQINDLNEILKII